MTHIEELASRNLSVWLDTTANYATYDAAGVSNQSSFYEGAVEELYYIEELC